MFKIMTMIGRAFVFFLSLFAGSMAWSQAGASAPKFSAGIYAFVGQGKMGNGLLGSGNAPDRDMLHTPVGLFLGFNMKKFRLGLNYEFNMIGQTTDPGVSGDGKLDGTNLTGTSTAPGVRLEYYDGKNSFGAVYRVSDQYKLQKQTFAGIDSTYKGSGGYSVQFMRVLKGKVGLIIDYTSQEYKESLSTGNVKWSRTGIGIVISNFSGAAGGKGRR